MNTIDEILASYNIKGELKGKTSGPLLDIIEFLPQRGTKLKEITAVLPDIKRHLGVTSLHLATKEDSSSVFFEIPRKEMETIDFNAILSSKEFNEAKIKYALPINIGVATDGSAIFSDLAKMPHLLIGGTTGSGKSVGLNTFILSLIASKTPDDIKFIMIDPKKIEFSIYNNQKYMYCPVITETKDAVIILAQLAEEMDRRYNLFATTLCKNLKEYNSLKDAKKLPYIICVIDEFADLMAMDKKVEKDVMRLAQKARASGIHLILATQRPSVDVITGVLKANFPTRLAYKVASSVDSRTILDTTGAEDLVGRGDCLFLASDGQLKRLHGAYMADKDIISMLKPYQARIKPLHLNKEDNQNTEEKLSSKKEKTVHKVGFFKSILNFWYSLTKKDKKLIINVLKYIFTFLMGIVSNNRSKKK